VADFEEKTEAPTPRRRTQARDQGQVARSQDLSAAVLLLTGLLFLKFLGLNMMESMLAVMKQALSPDRQSAGQVLGLSIATYREIAKILLPLFIGVFVVALAVQLAQVGWNITWKPLTPDIKRLNPVSGIKRLFSAKSFVTLAINIGKLTVITGVSWLSIAQSLPIIVYAINAGFEPLFGIVADEVFKLGIRLAAVLLVLALIDFSYQKHRHEKELKMTKQEVKDELRSMDGDPLIKRRRREVQLQLAMQRLQHDVPKADVVVTNPTHYSIALKYDPQAMTAPRVIAKGEDYIALRIRQIAAAARIPIVERKQLVRLMYDDVEIGQEIPEKFYQAVAEVLAYVYSLSGKKMPKPETADAA
jgi:flagellar biosynthetic protein FlhB